MSLVIDEAYLPATLTAPLMTDREFVEFCSQYPDYFIEMSAEGDILALSSICVPSVPSGT